MGGVYKCEWCGALGHKAAICRAQNAFAGACGTCGAYGHVQAVPRCPYARQRYHRRDARHVRASSSFRGNWRC